MLISFREVSIRPEKVGKCACGKVRRRRKKFWGTVSPFSGKSVREIYEQLDLEADKWRGEPITCDACSAQESTP